MRLTSLVGVAGLAGLAVASGEGTWTSDDHFCKMDKDLMISPSCNVTFTELNVINKKIRKDLVSLVRTDFFKYFKIDPDKECSFWENNDGLCFSRDCMVDVVTDWDSLPEIWQPEVLGKVDEESDEVAEIEKEWTFLDDLCDSSLSKSLPKPILADFDNNYCDIHDFTGENSVLVDLTKNPERFTGYGGQQSAQIWSSIYGENCALLGKSDQITSEVSESEIKMAKDVFFRFVSGLHASIGIHLSNDHLNTETGKWEPDLDLFMMRVGNFPERVTNVYFNYAVVGKSLWKIMPYLKEIEFCNVYNNDVKSKILNIVSQLDSTIFNEDLLFQNDISSSLKDDFRSRFKNVTRIMDCVHCDRCKLWGKVQTTGMATSLKILFDIDEADEESKQRFVDKLTKYELIALFNTFDKLSESVEYINNFEKLYKKRESGNGSLANFFQYNFFKLLDNVKRGLSSINSSNASDSSSNSTVEDTSAEKKIIEKEEKSVNSEEPSSVKQEKKTSKSRVTEQMEAANVQEDEQELFADIKLPERKKKIINQSNKNSTLDIWVRAWHTETHNVKMAIKFILQSYIDLPRNLWRMALVAFSKFWNRFVGVANYVSEEGEEILYDLDLH